MKQLYHRVLINVSDTPNDYENTAGPAEWSESRYKQMMYLRQKALDSARKQWADYLFVGFFAFSYQLRSNPVNTDTEGTIESLLFNRVWGLTRLNVEKM